MKKLLLMSLLAVPGMVLAPIQGLTPQAALSNQQTPAAITSNAQTSQINTIVAEVLANIARGGITTPRAERLKSLNHNVGELIKSLQAIAPQDLTDDAKHQIIRAYDALYKEANDLFELYKDSSFADYFTSYQNQTCKDLVKLQQTITTAKEKIEGYNLWRSVVQKPVSSLLKTANKNWTNRAITTAIIIAGIKVMPYTATFAYHNSGIFGKAVKWCITPGTAYTPKSTSN